VYVRVYTDPEKHLHLPVTSKPKNNMNLYSDYKTFVLIDPESKYANPVVVPLNQPQTFSYDFDLVLDKPDHYSGIVKVSYNQGANPYFDLLKDSTSQFGKILQNIQITKDGQLNVESITPLQSNIEFDLTSSTKAFLNEKNYWFLTLPKGNEGFDSWQLTALPDGRTTAIQLPAAINENYTFSLTLPKGFKLIGLPYNYYIYKVNQQNSIGSVVTEIKLIKKKVVVSRSLIIKKSMISPDEYKQLQEIVNVWRTEINKCLVFKAE
jgi:hypothetical protein